MQDSLVLGMCYNMLTNISNSAHYKEVLSRVLHVKESLWIGTADIKDLYIEDGKTNNVSSKRGQKELVLSAEREKGRATLKPFLDFDRFPILYDGLERVLCPRVHFKMMVFDGKVAYIGSANLTGAGIGMKADGTRNFEAGILTDEPEIVEQAMNQFDEVWIGKHCKTCKRKDFCPDPIVVK